MGANIKRESVLINPAISAAEGSFSQGNLEGLSDNPEKNIIARGKSSRDVLRQAYGR